MTDSISAEHFASENEHAVRGPSVAVRVVLVLALLVGYTARKWTFDHSYDIRSTTNQRNAFYWGDRIVRGANPGTGPAAWGALWRSYVGIYEADEIHPAEDAHTLDYSPLRLLMVGAWVNYLNIAYGPVSQWRSEFARSFTMFTMLMELAAAAAMFALVANWLKRTGTEDGRSMTPNWGRWELATAAAILLWLNPAAIVDSNVCPQSEAWVMPFYLLAVLGITRGWFFSAGIMLGIGAMFKGQMLLVAPALVMWPMFNRQWSAAARVAIGLAFGIGIVASPWLAHGSFAWARAGFAAHVKTNDVLRKGQSLNLPCALDQWFHLSLHQSRVTVALFGTKLVIEVKSALLILYVSLLVFCASAMARQAKSGDRWLLVSIAAPWAVMFFVLGQMDERYLVWAVGFSAGSIAVARWPFAAHAMLTMAAVATMIEGRLVVSLPTHAQLLNLLVSIHPVTGLLTTAGVVLLLFRPKSDWRV